MARVSGTLSWDYQSRQEIKQITIQPNWPGHSREVLLGDRWCVVLHDDGVGVGGISHNQNFDGLFGELFREVMYALAWPSQLMSACTLLHANQNFFTIVFFNGVRFWAYLIKGLSLDLEDFDIASKEVFPLHTFLAGHGSNHESSISVLEIQSKHGLQWYSLHL